MGFLNKVTDSFLTAAAKRMPRVFPTRPVKPETNPADQLGNPLRYLTPASAVSMLDRAMRGEYTDLQWAMFWIEQSDFDIFPLVERRVSTLSSMGWRVQVAGDAIQDDPEMVKLAEAQEKFLQKRYEQVENMYDVIEFLGLSVWRGYSHVDITVDNDTIALEPLDQWAWIRDGLYGPWYYNPEVRKTSWNGLSKEAEIDEDGFLIVEHQRNLARLAMIKYIRSNYSQKWWDRFLEEAARNGVVIVAPPGLEKKQVPVFTKNSEAIARSGSGVLPNGSDVKLTGAQSKSAGAPWEASLKYLRESMVLAATGGMLTSLAEAGGLGDGASNVQDKVFDRLAKRDARKISEEFQRKIDKPLLSAAFPNKPILAYFEISMQEESQPAGEVLADAAKAHTAGLALDLQELSERTGYTITRIPQPVAPPVAASSGYQPFSNRSTIKPAATDAATTSIPKTWSEPVSNLVKTLQELAADKNLSDEAFKAQAAALVETMPGLLTEMDVSALADVFEAGMLDAAFRTPPITNRSSRRTWIRNAEVRIGDANPDAVRKMHEKTPIASKFRTAEWADVPVGLRERAFFSANVESAKLLAEMKKRLQQSLAGTVDGTTVDRGRFAIEAQRIIDDEGLSPSADGSGGLRDIRSVRRLGLVYDHNTSSASEYARWKSGQDSDVLDEFPAQELIRVRDSKVKRDWQSRWVAAGGALHNGRMVALKTDPVWVKLSRFGTPWPPFDFGSGMGVENVDRDDAEDLGLVKPDDTVEPIEEDFNASLEASTANLGQEELKELQQAFGDQIKQQPGTSRMRWTPDALGEYAGAVNDGQNDSKAFQVGRISSAALARVPERLAMDNAMLRLEAGRARHIWKGHGPASRATDLNIPMGHSDWRLIQEAWRSPDKVTPGGNAKSMEFWKQLPDGDWFKLVVNKSGEKSAVVETAFKTKSRPPA